MLCCKKQKKVSKDTKQKKRATSTANTNKQLADPRMHKKRPDKHSKRRSRQHRSSTTENQQMMAQRQKQAPQTARTQPTQTTEKEEVKTAREGFQAQPSNVANERQPKDKSLKNSNQQPAADKVQPDAAQPQQTSQTDAKVDTQVDNKVKCEEVPRDALLECLNEVEQILKVIAESKCSSSLQENTIESAEVFTTEKTNKCQKKEAKDVEQKPKTCCCHCVTVTCKSSTRVSVKKACPSRREDVDAPHSSHVYHNLPFQQLQACNIPLDRQRRFYTHNYSSNVDLSFGHSGNVGNSIVLCSMCACRWKNKRY